jgi:hypothetical protein
MTNMTACWRQSSNREAFSLGCSAVKRLRDRKAQRLPRERRNIEGCCYFSGAGC